MVYGIFYSLIETAIAVVALVGNSYVIILFFHDVKLKLNRNFYLISLAFVNILNSLLAIPLTVLVR